MREWHILSTRISHHQLHTSPIEAGFIYARQEEWRVFFVPSSSVCMLACSAKRRRRWGAKWSESDSQPDAQHVPSFHWSTTVEFIGLMVSSSLAILFFFHLFTYPRIYDFCFSCHYSINVQRDTSVLLAFIFRPSLAALTCLCRLFFFRFKTTFNDSNDRLFLFWVMHRPRIRPYMCVWDASSCFFSRIMTISDN